MELCDYPDLREQHCFGCPLLDVVLYGTLYCRLNECEISPEVEAWGNAADENLEDLEMEEKEEER